jgi:hypothetical protein
MYQQIHQRTTLGQQAGLCLRNPGPGWLADSDGWLSSCTGQACPQPSTTTGTPPHLRTVTVTSLNVVEQTLLWFKHITALCQVQSQCTRRAASSAGSQRLQFPAVFSL